eukprot:NODE_358_length_8800_cov_0.946673.p1 type:complete len:541 gc:universal NODE_358_length_8800_cov_0.946673:2344-3966(+)
MSFYFPQREVGLYKDTTISLLKFVDMESAVNGIGSFQSFVRNCLQDLFILMADGHDLKVNEQLNMLYPLKVPLVLLSEICETIISSDSNYRKSKRLEIMDNAFLKDDQRQKILKSLDFKGIVLPNDVLLKIIKAKSALQIDNKLIQHILSHISKPLLNDIKNWMKFGCNDLPSLALDWAQDKLQFVCKYTKYTNRNEFWFQYIDENFVISPEIFSKYLCNDKQAKYEINNCISRIYLKSNEILIKEIMKEGLLDWLVAKKYYFLLLPSDSIEWFIAMAYNELSQDERECSTSRLQSLYESCHRLLFNYPTVKKRSRARGYMIEQTNLTPSKTLIQTESMKKRLMSHSLLDLLRLEYPLGNLIKLINDESIEQCYRNLFEFQWLLRVTLYELKQCRKLQVDKTVTAQLNYMNHVIRTIASYSGEILENHWGKMFTGLKEAQEISDMKTAHQKHMITMCEDCFLPANDVVIVLDLMRSTREFSLFLQKNHPDLLSSLKKWNQVLAQFKLWIKTQCQSNDSDWTFKVNGLLNRLDFNGFFESQ